MDVLQTLFLVVVASWALYDEWKVRKSFRAYIEWAKPMINAFDHDQAELTMVEKDGGRTIYKIHRVETK